MLKIICYSQKSYLQLVLIYFKYTMHYYMTYFRSTLIICMINKCNLSWCLLHINNNIASI